MNNEHTCYRGTSIRYKLQLIMLYTSAYSQLINNKNFHARKTCTKIKELRKNYQLC